MEDDRANGAAVGDDMWRWAEITEDQIRDALAKSAGNIRRTAKLLRMCPGTFRKFVKRRGMYEEIRQRWIPRQYGGGCDKGEIRRTEADAMIARSRRGVAHDDDKTDGAWLASLHGLLSGYEPRRMWVKVAAVAVRAIEAIDRKALR